MRVDSFLRAYSPSIPYSWWQKNIRKGHVRINGSRVSCSVRLSIGQELKFFLPYLSQLQKNSSLSTDSEFLAKYIIYEDDQLLIINKPAGLAVQGGSKVFSSVDQKVKIYGFRLTHRLDKDTSGILILAKDKITARIITQLFRERKIQKAYVAWVYGVPKNQTIIQPIFKIRDKMSIHPKGLFAYTEVFVINEKGWVLLFPKTGRTHQLRVHMQYAKTPIRGDIRYSDAHHNQILQNIYTRLFLHAFAVHIPNIGIIFAPLPNDFQLCNQLVCECLVKKIWNQ